MALKVLLLRKKLTDMQTSLADLERTAQGFETRETELAADIEAAQTDEERSVVEAAVESFEQERSQNSTAIEQARADIAELERQIREAEETSRQARSSQGEHYEERKDDITMHNAETRTRFFGMTVQQRDAFMANNDVKEFLSRVRDLKGKTRAVSGAELGIPTVMLDVLRANMGSYSKLVGKVRYRPLKGKARQNIVGAVPEAVWMEATDALNEMDFIFSQVELDGYKIGGFVAVPNSTLEDDDDLSLAYELMDQMGRAMGKGVDKSIAYGDGVKKPIGFVTRLAVSTKPSWWGTHQGEFSDLHTSNILKIDAAGLTGEAFFQKLIMALAVADPKYSPSGVPTWIMNRKTHMDIISRCLAFNANAALMAGMQNTMPIIGGEIVELEGCIGDYEIAGGYLDIYTLVERAGANVRSSDIPMMLQDQTVFVATQRMDGNPVIGEAFVLVSYDNSAAGTTAEFPEDYAGMDLGVLTVTSAAGNTSGKTAVTVTGNSSGATLKYKVTATAIEVVCGQSASKGWTAYSASTEIKAAAGAIITVVELDARSKVVKAGSVAAVPKA